MWDWIEKLSELRQNGNAFAVATLTKIEGSVPQEIGAKMIIRPDGKFWGTIGGGHIEKVVLEEAQKCLTERNSKLLFVDLGPDADQRCGGQAEVLIEILGDAPSVYVFGAGHVAQSLCQTLDGSAFTVHVIDERADWLNSEKLPSFAQRHNMHWESFIKTATWDAERSYVVIMTPDHKWDLDVLRAVIDKPMKYLGLMGSRTKWAGFQKDLAKEGLKKDAISRVHCPIGLPIGGNTPKEIALSISAEIVQTFHRQNPANDK